MSIDLALVVNIRFLASFTNLAADVLLYMRTTNLSMHCMWLELTVSRYGLWLMAILVLVTTGKAHQAFQAVRFPTLDNADTKSHPVKDERKGSQCLAVLGAEFLCKTVNRDISIGLPSAKATPKFSEPKIPKEADIQQYNVAVNCSDKFFLVSLLGSMAQMKQDPRVSLLMLAGR